jgi:hypothetical protein
MGKTIPTPRLKSGAKSTLEVAHLGRAEIFALPAQRIFDLLFAIGYLLFA